MSAVRGDARATECIWFARPAVGDRAALPQPRCSQGALAAKQAPNGLMVGVEHQQQRAAGQACRPHLQLRTPGLLVPQLAVKLRCGGLTGAVARLQGSARLLQLAQLSCQRLVGLPGRVALLCAARQLCCCLTRQAPCSARAQSMDALSPPGLSAGQAVVAGGRRAWVTCCKLDLARCSQHGWQLGQLRAFCGSWGSHASAVQAARCPSEGPHLRPEHRASARSPAAGLREHPAWPRHLSPACVSSAPRQAVRAPGSPGRHPWSQCWQCQRQAAHPFCAALWRMR